MINIHSDFVNLEHNNYYIYEVKVSKEDVEIYDDKSYILYLRGERKLIEQGVYVVQFCSQEMLTLKESYEILEGSKGVMSISGTFKFTGYEVERKSNSPEQTLNEYKNFYRFLIEQKIIKDCYAVEEILNRMVHEFLGTFELPESINTNKLIKLELDLEGFYKELERHKVIRRIYRNTESRTKCLSLFKST